MKKVITLIILAFQITFTFILTFFTYMVFALLDSDFGIDGLFGLFIIQPVIGIIISLLTIIFCLVIGLPIRVNNRLNNWWKTNYYLSIIGVIIGLICIYAALLPIFGKEIAPSFEPGVGIKHIPNVKLVVIGWFLMTFSSLHIYPPRQLIELGKIIFGKFSN